jgi:type II pantothenate kinase
MSDSSGGPIISIDRGASFTDFGVVESHQLIETASIETRDWDRIEKSYLRLTAKYKNEHTVFTGSVAGMPSIMENQIHIIPEIDAIGFGGATLSGCSDCLVVSAGTGTAMVHFSKDSSKHVGGTGVGGGTIKGLAGLMCGLDNPVATEKKALQGDASKLNLTISDLGYEDISFLGSDVTAGNFAAVNSKNVEDLSAAILCLVGETIGIIASLCAREFNCRENIVMVGKVVKNKYIRHTLDLVGTLYQTRFIFPDNPGYATVFGAAIKFLHDLEA